MFQAYLRPGTFYAFELTARANRVVAYPEPSLTSLAIWSSSTLREIGDGATLGAYVRPNVEVVEAYPIADFGAGARPLHGLPAHGAEGVVVVDSEFRRLKIRSPAYVLAQRLCRASTPRAPRWR